MKILCVLNPRAAGGTALQRWPSIAALLGVFRVEYELLADPNRPIDAQLLDFIERHPINGLDAIAGIGGDGTHSALINALINHQARHPETVLPPYAFVPMGTGNDIAKSFGMASREDFFVNDLRRAVSTIVHGADYRLDLGVLNGVYFADALSIGLDSRILHERNIQLQKIRDMSFLRRISKGKVMYTLCAAGEFWRRKPTMATVTVDGEAWHSGPILNLVVKNTRIYAGDFDLCPDAYADDGLLDVVLFTDRWDYVKKYLIGIRHNPDKIRQFSDRMQRVSTYVQGRKIEIRLSRAEAAQLDGEEIPSSDLFEVSVAPKAIRIKTPAEP